MHVQYGQVTGFRLLYYLGGFFYRFFVCLFVYVGTLGQGAGLALVQGDPRCTTIGGLISVYVFVGSWN